MITKKRLRERLMDFARGAGCPWSEDGYFDDWSMEGLQRFMYAVRDGLGYPSDCEFFGIAWLDVWDDLDKLVELFYENPPE